MNEHLFSQVCPDCGGCGRDSQGRECWTCHGKGRVITEAGEQLMDFLRDFLLPELRDNLRMMLESTHLNPPY